jgi:hypothetical protein
MKNPAWFFLALSVALGACGDGSFVDERTMPGGGVVMDPVTPPPVPAVSAAPPAGKVLFAFKTGLDGGEQVWLWLEGDRQQQVSTWPSQDREQSNVRSTGGYHEGSGRFGQLQFDHQRRFLLAIERISAGPMSNSTWRLFSYELATGKTTFTSLTTGTGSTEGRHLGETRILVSASATVVLIPVPSGPYSAVRTVFEWQDGRLVAAASDQPMTLPGHVGRTAVDLAGEAVLVANQVWRRQQGRWRPVISTAQPSDSFTEPRVAPGQDAVCLIQYSGGIVPWLLTADGDARMLPCQGRAFDCAFSPDGSLLYLTGCAQPVVTREGTARVAPRVELFGDARAGSGEAAVTLGVIQKDRWMVGPPPSLVAFDWRTLTTRPRSSEEFRTLGERCRVHDIRTPAGGAGIGLVNVSCGCIDCDNGTRYALDVSTEKLHQIYRPGGSSFIRGSILLGSAVVSTATVGDRLDTGPTAPATVFWSDAAGTRTLGPLAGVPGPVHDLVAY